MRFEIIVFQNVPKCKKLKHINNIGVDNCHLIKYNINFFNLNPPNNKMASPLGFEPRTLALEGRCSIQLS